MSCNCPKCLYNDPPEPQRLINAAVEEIQQKLAINNDSALPLSPTEFKCIDTEGEIITLDSRQIPGGTLIDYSGSDYYTMEAFRALASNVGAVHKYAAVA